MLKQNEISHRGNEKSGRSKRYPPEAGPAAWLMKHHFPAILHFECKIAGKKVRHSIIILAELQAMLLMMKSHAGRNDKDAIGLFPMRIGRDYLAQPVQVSIDIQ